MPSESLAPVSAPESVGRRGVRQPVGAHGRGPTGRQPAKPVLVARMASAVCTDPVQVRGSITPQLQRTIATPPEHRAGKREAAHTDA